MRIDGAKSTSAPRRAVIRKPQGLVRFGTKGVSQPVRLGPRLWRFVEADYVEACRAHGERRLAGEKGAGGTGEPSLFARVDRIDRARQRPADTASYLDEYEHFAVEHDEIELAVTAAEVTRDEGEASGFEPAPGMVFRATA